jgi:hypothetical protein
MKHLKLFENKNSNKEVKNAVDEYTRIGDLIRDYIKFTDTSIEIMDVYYYYYETDLEEIGDVGLIISYTGPRRTTSDDYVYTICNEELESLYVFIKDPELYMSSKKFNL